MGVSLSYTSTEPVGPEVQKAIKADAKRLNRTREWWAENLILYKHPDRPKHLSGDTKVCLGLGGEAYLDEDERETTEADLDDDLFMEMYEARFILQTLARWSKEHGVSWVVSMAGEEVCRVADGIVDPSHALGYDDPPEKIEAEDRQAAEIRKRHANRYE